MYGGINPNRLGPVHPSLKDTLRFGTRFDWQPGRPLRITKAGLNSPLLFNKSTLGKNHLDLKTGGFLQAKQPAKQNKRKKTLAR
ncbi:MAG: hypothetical protein Q4A28_03890 [Brachymonas sp.]|nr:hypothetical protein [Brachymonas sp.]